MDENIFLPEEFDTHAVGDERFALAYEATDDRQRSLLKSLIAALWNCYPPKRVHSERCESHWTQGGGLAFLHRPLSWAILCIDASTAAPALVLSALMPALTSGITEIGVMGIGSGALTTPLLTALELAGQERVVELQAHEASKLANRVTNPHLGLAMCLGRGAQAAFANSQLSIWSPKPRSIGPGCPSGFLLGVFLERKQQFSKQLKLDIDYLLPGVAIEWWSPSGRLGPNRGELHKGDFASFENRCFDAVLVPDDLSHQALATFPAVFVLDRAGHWLWPGLADDHFRLRHAALI